MLNLVYFVYKEMKIGALLTSAGINIGLCILFLSFYSILRKQPQNVKVYFGRRIAEQHKRLRGAFILEIFVSSHIGAAAGIEINCFYTGKASFVLFLQGTYLLGRILECICLVVCFSFFL